MPSTASPLTHDNVAEFWRRRFRRQRHVNAGVRSLLQKYGTASSAAAVSSDFLLTLMGNLVASEACFYRTSDDDCALVPRAAFGSNTPDELPRIALDNAFGQILAQGGPPQLLNALPRSVTDGDALGPITGRYKLFAPLYFEDHLGGVVFLGPKVSGAAFTDNDMELVEALCAVTAAVLRYKDWRQAASGFADRNAMMLNRCREVAGGVADHLEHMLSTIDTLAVADGAAAGADEVRSRLQEMSRRTDAMHYLVASLRQVANDPAQTDTPSSETCNAVAAVQSAVMSLLSREGSAPPALSFRHQLEGGENRVPFRHSTVVAAAGETLQCIVKPGVSLSMLAVRVDTAAGLPAEIGAVSNTPPSGTDGHPARRMLRIRLAAHDDNDNGTDAPSGMKMLADNLEAFQTLREPGPSQAALVEHGGTILWRREHDVTTYLIYLPLASV